MSNKLYFSDLGRHNVKFTMRDLVRRFFPSSWLKHLHPLATFTLYDFLVNKAFGECCEDIGIMFDGKVCPCAGCCTFVNIGGHKGLLVADPVEHRFYEWPEWGLGVYAEVGRFLTKFVSKTMDPWNDYTAVSWEGLEQALLVESRGRRVFEALGILGGTWSPAEGVAPSEKALDIPN